MALGTLQQLALLLMMQQQQQQQFAQAGGGLQSLKQNAGYAQGGLGAVAGPGGGQDDQIPAMLSDGEFVFDAETVSMLGDGSTEEGAKRLEDMRRRIRKHKRKAPLDKIAPKAKVPGRYLGGI